MLRTICLLFFLILNLSVSAQNTLFMKSRAHRIVRIMRNDDFDLEKVHKKIARFKERYPERLMDESAYKLFYAESYSGESYNLCEYHMKKDTISHNGYLKLDCDSLNAEFNMNGLILNYLYSNKDLAEKWKKKYKINTTEIICTQNYLINLIDRTCKKEEIKGGEINKPLKVDTTLVKNKSIVEGFESSFRNDSGQQSTLTVFSENGKVFVQFDLFQVNGKAFETGSYELSSDRHLNEFFGKLQDSVIFDSIFLVYSSVRGEADIQHFPETGKIFNSTTLVPEVHCKVELLDPISQQAIETFTLSLINGDSYTQDKELATLRAMYAKNLFANSLKMDIEKIQVIDHRKDDYLKVFNQMSQTEFEEFTAKQRRISYFLIFSDKSLEDIPDFYVRLKNFKIEYETKKPTLFEIQKDFGIERSKIIQEFR